jgi:hypothetical protein
LETGFGFGFEMQFHNSQFREALRSCQSDLQ